jgi:hypothetical protein
MYDNYKTTNEWSIVQKAITDLIENQDIELTTTNDLVVGYITKYLIESKENGA